MKLVELADAKAHLNMDHSSDDDLIGTYIDAASAAVLNYMKIDGSDYEDSSGVNAELIPDDVKIATLILVHYFYNDRGGDDPNSFERGYLPKPVTALLYAYRDPTAE